MTVFSLMLRNPNFRFAIGYENIIITIESINIGIYSIDFGIFYPFIKYRFHYNIFASTCFFKTIQLCKSNINMSGLKNELDKIAKAMNKGGYFLFSVDIPHICQNINFNQVVS